MRLACVPYDGDDYLLVLDADARVVSPDEVERMAVRRLLEPFAEVRRFRFVLVDESAPAFKGGNRPFDVRGFTWGWGLPVEVDCGGYTHMVGIVDDLVLTEPGSTSGTTGWHLVGTAHLFRSMLADLVWGELIAGRLTAICVRAEVSEEDGERNRRGRFLGVRIDYPARVCLAGARVLAHWGG